MADVHSNDLTIIITRIEIIKSLISLEEEDEINTHISKLEQLALSASLKSIIVFLKEKSYTTAVIAIDVFIKQHRNLTIYHDPKIDALKLEIKSLEAEINFLSNEKAALEKLIHEFGIRHTKELGELLIKILQHRKANTKGTPQQQEAEDDYNSYHQEYEATKNEEVATLTSEEQNELKSKYRKASKLCHPDVVSEEQNELATKIFAELSAAYEKNDLKRVKEILENLENGTLFIAKSDAINEMQMLQSEMEKQRLKVIKLKEQLEIIKESSTYKTINSIDNWDVYFNSAKSRLRLQLDDLNYGK